MYTKRSQRKKLPSIDNLGKLKITLKAVKISVKLILNCRLKSAKYRTLVISKKETDVMVLMSSVVNISKTSFLNNTSIILSVGNDSSHEYL